MKASGGGVLEGTTLTTILDLSSSPYSIPKTPAQKYIAIARIYSGGMLLYTLSYDEGNSASICSSDAPLSFMQSIQPTAPFS